MMFFDNFVSYFARYSRKSLLVLTILILFVSILIWVIYLSAENKKSGQFQLSPSPTQAASSISQGFSYPQTATVYPVKQKIAKAGEETIYGQDAENIISIYYSQELASPAASLDGVKSRALTRAINDSVVLQMGRKLNLANLTPEIFNNSNKDETQRIKAVAEIIRKLKSKEEKVSGAKLAVWFHNQDITALPFAQAEALAKRKIYGVYNRLISGEITFKEAGQIIQNDQELAMSDKNYKSNAYREFTGVPAYQKIFTYEQLDKIARSLKVGEMSQVIRIPPEGTPFGTNEEEFYAIIKVDKHENIQAGSYLDWLEKEKQSYEITIY